MNPVTPLLEVRGITKTFPPDIVANDDVNLAVYKGEILGLVGENGAGKTTLMRIVFGLERPDKGEIFWQGQRVSITSPQYAMKLGIGMVHQHFQLFPSLSVMENVILGNEVKTGAFLNRQKARKIISDLVMQFEFDLDPDVPVRTLSVGQQQKVEILKTLYRKTQLLILDEPTAVLAPQEVDTLLALLLRLAQSGIGIILISHKLREIIHVASRIVVMRKGRVVADVQPAEVTEVELARLMVGTEFQEMQLSKTTPKQRQQPLLSVKDLSVLGDHGRVAVDSVTFDVWQGEIVGIAGIEGNGQQELVEAIVGVRKVKKGKILLCGKDITLTPPTRRRSKLAVIPGDRIKEGSAPLATVAENLISINYHKTPYSRGGILNWKRISAFASEAIKAYGIIATPNTLVRTLSGGNLQRVVIARELSSTPPVLIAVYPTRGLDVRSTAEVWKRLATLREQGVGVMLISSDLDELLALSDRILVIFRGRIVGEVSPQTTSIAQIGLLMLGGSNAHQA